MSDCADKEVTTAEKRTKRISNMCEQLGLELRSGDPIQSIDDIARDLEIEVEGDVDAKIETLEKHCSDLTKPRHTPPVIEA